MSMSTSTKSSRILWNTCLLFLLCYGITFNAFYRPSSQVSDLTSEFYSYKLNSFYAPSRIERYSLEHAVELNFHRNVPDNPGMKHTSPPKGCTIWQPSTRYISDYLQGFKHEMDQYNYLLQKHPGSLTDDVRKRLNVSCPALQVHPQGLGAVFTSGSLSRSPTGLLEPVYTPFGSWTQKCAGHGRGRSHELDFLVHDFMSMCQKLIPTSKIIFMDVGYDVASKWTERKDSPTIKLLRLYRKFGFPVDSIYVFDSKKYSQQDWTSHIHQVSNWDSNSKSILQEFTWKDPQTGRGNHPWDWIAKNAAPEDLVLVTLQLPPRGVDPTREMELLQELPTSSHISQKIDELYFHPTVYMAEDESLLSKNKKDKKNSEETLRWTVQEALLLFAQLRGQGIHAHAWVS